MRLMSPGRDSPDWYLQEWLDHFGKRQAALVNELGWDKSKASFIWNGKQPYRRNLVNEVARWLGIRPYELLMHPREAQSLRRLRQTAAQIVAEEESPPWDTSDHQPPRLRATGA